LTSNAWQQVVRGSAVPWYGSRYRRWVADSLRYVDVQDLATGGDHIPQLSDVYVDVALVTRARDQDGSLDWVRDTSERHSISDYLDRRPRVVLALIGQPGCGKSTLLAHAARRSAQQTALGRPGRRRVPVLLALREHAGPIVADPEISLPKVIRAAVGDSAGSQPDGWWERQLRRGRCLVLLDGMDEIAYADDRLVVAKWIERQVAAHPGNHFVITARPHGVPEQLAAQAEVLVIRPFTAEQVQLFLDRWYLAAERHATGASGRSALRASGMRAGESATRLRSLLWDHSALHDLAVNPLLLTMIATAHRYRGALPGSRADLYGEICQVLLSRRSQAKDLPELLSWPAKQGLLAALAYQMMRDHVSEVPAGRALEILGPQLERFSSSVTGEAFLDDIARNGLLIEPSAGRYAFTHLTFQEYLAARHVSTIPDLVKSLADSVNDVWWYETILLYAANADASPIVRACLDSGTIPALTLAFDCAEASTEIDPDLRQRLDRERRRAYEPDCSPRHRRLIAGVLAARLVRQARITAAGARVCTRPVPADLYWLFLADTQAPRPDSACEPHDGQPATGIWGTEAQALVGWLNSITATATGIEVRLPYHDELQDPAVAGDLERQLPASVTSAWTHPAAPASAAPGLWLRPGQPHPHELTGAAIRAAVAADMRNTTLLPQVITAAVLGVALNITRDLEDIRVLAGALVGDLAARADSGGETVDLLHAHAHAIMLTYAHALGLSRSELIVRTCAAPDVIGGHDVTQARALAESVAGDLAGDAALARNRAAELAQAIDLDLSVLSAFDFDLAQARELARAHAVELARAYSTARAIPDTSAPALARVFGLAGRPAFDPVLPLPGVLGLPLRWTAEGALASTMVDVLAASPSPSPAATAAAAADQGAGRPLLADPGQAFVLTLSSRARIDETTQLKANLGSSLSDVLRDLTAAASARTDGSPDWNQVTGLGQLTNATAPMFTVHQPPTAAEAAALRAVALALASGPVIAGTDLSGILRTVAATVTLVERRSKGESTAGEAVVLALA
jgi:energy-coupling factor transporter ATP-binding protein EcfA2